MWQAAHCIVPVSISELILRVTPALDQCPVLGYKTDALWKYKCKLLFYCEILKVIFHNVISIFRCPVNRREIYSRVEEHVNSAPC
jgi:hypothetical protein